MQAPDMLAPKPKRIQRRRIRGWTMPENCVGVGRPGKLGNPFVCDNPADAVTAFRTWLARQQVRLPAGSKVKGSAFVADREEMLRAIQLVRGKDVACWCAPCPEHATGKPLGVSCGACPPCHGDIILEIANG